MNLIQPADWQPDDLWPLRAADSGNTGTAFVYRAPGRAEVRHPLLVVEGFPGSHPLSYLLDVLGQHDLMRYLLEQGYDVVLLGLDQGSDDIRRNAGVVEAAIEALQARTPHPLVLAGMSMGGLVLRHALLRMERGQRDHRCAVMLTLDTPHGGAYTSLAAQWFAQQFRGVDPVLAQLAGLLDSPANQQFVVQWLHEGTVQASPLRQAFLAELQALGGYPQRCRRWAIASGRGDGGYGLRPQQRVFDWTDAAGGHAARLWTQGEGGAAVRLAQGHRGGVPLPPLEFASAVSGEGLPGGQSDNLRRAADVAGRIGGAPVVSQVPWNCAVPTASALDLPGDPLAPIPPQGAPGCPFHAYRYQPADLPHLRFDADTAAWLLKRLGQAERLAFHDPAFDPNARAFLCDPYPVYAQSRQHLPVQWVSRYGAWWVFRDADVRRVLQDDDGFRKRMPGAPEVLSPFDVDGYLPPGLFSADPPWHTELRGYLGPLFRAAIADAPAVATEEAEACLATLRAGSAAAGGRADLVSAYALPVPARILFRLMGVPDGHRPLLLNWVTAAVIANDVTQTDAVRAMGGTAVFALRAYFQGLLHAPPAAAPRTLLERLIDGAQRGGLRPDAVQASLVNLAVAGYLSTTFLIGTGLRHLLANPDGIAALLHGDAATQAAVIEELLRLDAPAQIVDRVAVKDLTLGGAPVRAGDRLMLVLGSANRDRPEAESPDAFRPDRGGATHLSFGEGIHHCIGAPLARIVTPLALRLLLQHLPGLRLAGLAQWQTDPYLRGLSNLPVAWD